jgi:hypothetical protein
MEPQVGEIWQHNDNSKYFLILETYEERSYTSDAIHKKWKFLHLNDGVMDGAFLQFFDTYCQKVA